MHIQLRANMQDNTDNTADDDDIEHNVEMLQV